MLYSLPRMEVNQNWRWQNDTWTELDTLIQLTRIDTGIQNIRKPGKPETACLHRMPGKRRLLFTSAKSGLTLVNSMYWLNWAKRNLNCGFITSLQHGYACNVFQCWCEGLLLSIWTVWVNQGINIKIPEFSAQFQAWVRGPTDMNSCWTEFVKYCNERKL